MDTQATSLPLDSRLLQQSIGQTLLSQMQQQQLHQGSVCHSARSGYLKEPLSFELVKYACHLVNSPQLQRVRISTDTAVPRYSTKLTSGFAPPIMPLQKRDRTILVDLFERTDMSDIHTDITSQLGRLIPEPCWEDDPYGFLSDYL